MKRKYSSRAATRKAILSALTHFPGATTREIVDLLGNIELAPAVNIINQLYTQGHIFKNGTKPYVGTNGILYKPYTYAVSDTPIIPKPKKPAAKDTTDSNVPASLTARIAQLEAWKSDAIARYPDLAADPIVLKARRLVADEVRASGDDTLADRISMGRKDDGLLMRVVIKALEEAHG
jgi:hypothetical protein